MTALQVAAVEHLGVGLCFAVLGLLRMDSSELRPADLWEHQSTFAHTGPSVAPAEASFHFGSTLWLGEEVDSRPSWGGSGGRRTREFSGIPQ